MIGVDYAHVMAPASHGDATDSRRYSTSDAIEMRAVCRPADPANTMLRLIELMGQEGEDDYGRLGPTQHALHTAMKLVASTDKLLNFEVVGSPSVGAEGGIRLEWHKGRKELRLVCPADPLVGEAYLYQESDSESVVFRGLTPELLAKKLAWLVSGDDLL